MKQASKCLKMFELWEQTRRVLNMKKKIEREKDRKVNVQNSNNEQCTKRRKVKNIYREECLRINLPLPPRFFHGRLIFFLTDQKRLLESSSLSAILGGHFL